MGKDVWKDMYQLDKYSRERVMRSVRLLYPYLKDGDKVTDIGCYTQHARAYLPKNVEYIGLDSDHYTHDTLIYDCDESPHKVVSNHALLLETLEHLQHPGKLLDNLCLDGVLIVSVPNEATLFHRLRSLFGMVDGNCWSDIGKHLHLPSLGQTRTFLQQRFEILDEQYYISPLGHGSKHPWVGRILCLIPDKIHLSLAYILPSLFARGFIFVLQKKLPE